MTLWVYILFLIFCLGLTILFLILFYRNWKNPKSINGKPYSIKRFWFANAATIYLLLALVFLIATSTIAALF